jgi:hypothetical protein
VKFHHILDRRDLLYKVKGLKLATPPKPKGGRLNSSTAVKRGYHPGVKTSPETLVRLSREVARLTLCFGF